MSRIILIVFLLGLGATASAAELLRSERAIPDQYIVVFKAQAVLTEASASPDQRAAQLSAHAQEIAGRGRGRVERVYQYALTGFSVAMSEAGARSLLDDPRIDFIVEDARVEAAALNVQLDPPSWGLDRIDQPTGALDGAYAYIESDDTVRVYVLDTGIRASHSEFAGRVDVLNGFNAIEGDQNTDDCHGHGTHVAGIIGGQSYGVAKNATLVPVRVLDCNASGALSKILSGIDYVTGRALDEPHPAVANLSLSNGMSSLMDQAIKNSIDSGVTYVVAAGNFGYDACFFSPGRLPEAITVGATTVTDQALSFSNDGPCVDLWAPGADIFSAFNRSDTDSLSITGTSASAPHVAGIAANLLVQDPALSPAEVHQLIVDHATATGTPFGPDSNDLLAYAPIVLDAGPEVSVDFSVSCGQRSRQCMFSAALEGNVAEAELYYWEFGDGNVRAHPHHIARNRYRDGGHYQVLLAVVLADGSVHTAEREILVQR